jgi:ubiquinone/menaquinone biosynthesis C-methylase UbiE
MKTIFDDVAHNYRDIHDKNIKISGGTSETFAEYKPAEISRRLKSKPVGNILDFGCGDGISEIFFRKFFPESKLYGIDVSSASIHAARNRHVEYSFFDVFDGYKIPFKDNHFDMVFLSCVLHHINHDKHPSVLAECYRVLRPGGHLFIFEHNPLNPLTQKVVRECVFDKDAALIKPARLKNTVQSVRFKKNQITYTLFFPRYKLFTFFLQCERFMGFIPFGGQYYIYSTKLIKKQKETH